MNFFFGLLFFGLKFEFHYFYVQHNIVYTYSNLAQVFVFQKTKMAVLRFLWKFYFFQKQFLRNFTILWTSQMLRIFKFSKNFQIKQILLNWRHFLWKKERFDSAGYRAQDLSIASRILYHLSYGGSSQLFWQNLFTPHVATDKPVTIFWFIQIISVDYVDH